MLVVSPCGCWHYTMFGLRSVFAKRGMQKVQTEFAWLQAGPPLLQLKPSAAAKLSSIISGNVVGQGEFDGHSLRYVVPSWTVLGPLCHVVLDLNNVWVAHVFVLLLSIVSVDTCPDKTLATGLQPTLQVAVQTIPFGTLLFDACSSRPTTAVYQLQHAETVFSLSYIEHIDASPDWL